MEPNDLLIGKALSAELYEQQARANDDLIKRDSQYRHVSPDSQCRKIARHLIKGGSISNMTAFKIYGIVSLHRRLFELREQGFPVNFGRFVQYGSKRFKIYELYPNQDIGMLTKRYV